MQGIAKILGSVVFVYASIAGAWAALAQAVDSQAEKLEVREDSARLILAQGQREILAYNKVSPPVPDGIDPVYARSGFVHPIRSPAGKVLTATFPIDHAHQHGLFSAWVKTRFDNREIDFWNLAGRTGRVRHQQVVSTFDTEDAVGFEVDLTHQIVSPPSVDVLRERWKITAHPTDGSYFCFDLETTQQALTDTPLIVQKYHYGGVALRGRVEWIQGEKLPPAEELAWKQEPSDFLNDLGSHRERGNHQKSRWVAMFGDIDGQPACITVLCHADNFRAPQAARIHPTKPYFCFAPCVEGQFTIDQQHPLSERYRYLVTDSRPQPEWIEQQWQAWCGQ